MKRVYLDYAATSPVKDEVLKEMLPYFSDVFGNPSSVYSYARESKKAIDKARDIVATTINAKAKEIYFTGSGSEADNWAIKGVASALKNKGKHIITSKIEHHAVLHTCEYLEREGFEVTYLDVDENGFIDLVDLENSIREDTILISIMYANNEIGTILPIKQIVEIAKRKSVLVHTDAVQVYGNILIDVIDLGVDLLSLSAHKIYGPKGVGALYIKRGTKINSLIYGGAQEMKKRAGTENIAGIIGFAKAAELAIENIEEHATKLKKLRDKLIEEITKTIPHIRLNGDPIKRLPGNVNICFKYIEGEALLLSLDLVGIAASSGSACTSGSLDPSHVLMAIGLTHEIAHGSLRLSIGDFNSEEDIDYVLEKLPEIVQRLRDMSPLYEEVIGGN
ncbi:MAG: cysteine desulfurase NifS [Alkaliphilus sp.]|nr:MAG: cysteine desulfurase NifS [Alkaliphilus sp.]